MANRKVKEKMASEKFIQPEKPELEDDVSLDFEDDTDYSDLNPVSKWSYPSMGYDATNGIMYIGEDPYEGEITLQILAPRRKKYVVDAEGTTHNYPINTPGDQMVKGSSPKTHVQFIIRAPELEEEGDPPALFILGSDKYTTRQAFWNNRSGKYHDDRFPVGLFYQLEDHVAEVLEKKGKSVPFYAWNLKIQPEENRVNIVSFADPNKSSNIHRIILAEPLTLKSFVGAGVANQNKQLIIDEDLQEWSDSWNKKRSTVEVSDNDNDNDNDYDYDDDFDDI